MSFVDIYWTCFIGGTLFAVVTVIFGDALGDVLGGVFDGLADALGGSHLDIFSPVVFVGGLTVFGGTGIMLTQYSPLRPPSVILFSFCISVGVSLLVYFLYVRPMKNAENSVGFSMSDLVGKIGEVSVTIPEQGFGEVIVRIGAGNTNQIAGSYDYEVIPVGAKVVVGEVKEGVLLVFKYDEQL